MHAKQSCVTSYNPYQRGLGDQSKAEMMGGKLHTQITVLFSWCSLYKAYDMLMIQG